MLEVKGIDVKYVAQLARIELAPESQAAFQRDLESIVGYIDKLKTADVTGIEPTAHAAALTNVWREDKAKQGELRSAMLANAPATIDGETIKVPRVLPGEES